MDTCESLEFEELVWARLAGFALNPVRICAPPRPTKLLQQVLCVSFDILSYVRPVRVTVLARIDKGTLNRASIGCTSIDFNIGGFQVGVPQRFLAGDSVSNDLPFSLVCACIAEQRLAPSWADDLACLSMVRDSLGSPREWRLSYSVAILQEQVVTSAASQDQDAGIGLDACDLFSAAISTQAAYEPHVADEDDAPLRVGQVPYAHIHIPIGSSLEVLVTLDLSQLLLPDVVALGELLSGAPTGTGRPAGKGGEASSLGEGGAIGGDAKRARTETVGGSISSNERAALSRARSHRSCLAGAALRAMPPIFPGSCPRPSVPAGSAKHAGPVPGPGPDPSCGLQPAVDRFLGLVMRRLHADATACLLDVIEAAGKLNPRYAGDAASPAGLMGSTVPRLMGSTVPRLMGSTVPRLMGSTVPRLMGSTVPRLMGSTVPRLMGSTVPRPLLAEPGSSGPASTSALGRIGADAPAAARLSSSVHSGTAARGSQGAGADAHIGSSPSSEPPVVSNDELRVCILCFGGIDERSTAGSDECLQCSQCHSWMHLEHLQVWLEANKASTSALGRLKGPCPHCEGLMSIAI